MMKQEGSTERNAILLRRESAGWTATFVGPHGDEVKRLFGGRTIPTPFTASALPLKVQTEIAKRNPCVDVVFESF